MKEKWLVATKRADFNKWASEYNISPVLARIIRNRDIIDEQELNLFLNGSLEDCHSPWLLYDMEKAVSIILNKIENKTPIRVIGDYDVDGICSSFILEKGLSALGALVDTAIPHRIHDGYGLNDALIEEAYKDGIQMIITCDNGISAVSQIQKAIDYGMTVIITDHHEVPYLEEGGKRREILPAAHAIVNPKQEQCHYPFPNICGGVVVYKLIQALLERTQSKQLEAIEPELLVFAAIATVCDVMELRNENRIIVKYGLAYMRHIQNEGLKALIEVNGIELNKLSAYHLGFVIGPCLNATGRLDTALRAIDLLNSKNKVEAMSAASELKELNDSRKNMTLQGVEEAEHYILMNRIAEDKVMLVYLPKVHESLAGIIAGRIREKYNRPVFVLTKGEEGIKGSGRSIEAYDMYEAMTEVKQYFTKFGGHKLAAGLSMKEEDLSSLRHEINQKCILTEEDFIPRVHIDVPMPVTYADKALATDLERLEPFGVGNPKPLFAQKDLLFIRGFKMGVKQNFARFRAMTPEGLEKEFVFFGDLNRFIAFLDKKYGIGSGERLFTQTCQYEISITYQLSINYYRGNETLQFIIQNYN